MGGLVAATAFALHLIAHNATETRRVLRCDPKFFIGVGLGLAILSGLWALLSGHPFLTGEWNRVQLPVVGKLGTPLLFDVGVYLLVFGSVVTILLSLLED